MQKPTSPGLYRFGFRAISLYFFFYIVFQSDMGAVFRLHFVSIEITRLANYLFVHKDFKDMVPVADFIWHYLACLSFFVIAVIVSLIWTLVDKGKRFKAFPKYAYVFIRYYLAAMMLSYGVNKLDELQFTLLPSRLIQPVGATDTFDLFWVLMGASKSYSFFGGLLEVTAAFLLFCRRTTTLGAMIAFSALLNVFLLDMSYGPALKLLVLNLLLMSLFLLARDLKAVYTFFISRQTSSLPIPVPPLIGNKRFVWVQPIIKYLLIAWLVYGNIKLEMDLYHQIHHLPYQQMVGIHTIKDFHSAKDPGNSGAYAWKKIAVDPFDAVKIQWANDSCAYFSLKVDSTKKTMELEAWNDSSSKAFLHYKQTGVTEWSFEGMYKTDSIHFATDYSNIHSLPLLKERGTIHWIYGLK